MTEQHAVSGGRTTVTTGIDVAGDNRGIIVVGDHAVLNVSIDAQHGSRVSDFRGTLPTLVRRERISLLPRRGGGVIGRDQELSDLRTALGTNGLIQLCGPAGIGKSALLRYAARSLEPGPDGVVYLHAGDREAAEIAREIFKACYVAPDYVPSAVEMQHYLQHLRLRIYVDDPRFSETGLKQLMDIVQNSALVFTAEQRIAGTAVRTVPVGGLDESASINLLAHHLNRSLRDDERPAAVALCAAANGSPLQLRRFAASGKAGLPAPKPLPSLLPALLRQQSPEAGDVLHLMASVGGNEIAPAHLDALLGRGDCEQLCRELARTGLVVETDIGYRCPADVVGEVLKSRGVWYPTEKLCGYLTAWAADTATSPDAVADHHRVLDVVVLRAERNGYPDLGVALARAASPKLERSLHFSAWGTLLGAGWRAAEAANDKSAKAYFLNEEGIRCVVTGKLTLAALLLGQAVLLWQELGILHKIQAAHQSAQFAASGSFPAIGAHSSATVAAQANGHMAAIAPHHLTPALVHTSTATHTVVPTASSLISPGSPVFTPPPITLPVTPSHATLVAQPRPTYHMPGSGSVTHTAQPAHGVGQSASTAHHHGQVIDLRHHLPSHSASAPGGHLGTNASVHHQHVMQAHHTANAGAGGHGVVSTTVAKMVTALVISGTVYGAVALAHHHQTSALPSRDLACQSAVPAIARAVYSTNGALENLEFTLDYYKAAVNAGGQGDFDSVQSADDELISDLHRVQSAIQSTRYAATTSAVGSALDTMDASISGHISTFQSLSESTYDFDTHALADQFNSAWRQLAEVCGE